GASGGTHAIEFLRTTLRRKQVDYDHGNSIGTERFHLARALTASHLVAIGVGAAIGSGVYILVGTVAREHSGPALTISFLVAGIAAALSGLCYAELSCRCPSAGSAYHYTYVCIGEVVAWLIGWALMLEYTIGGSAVARGMAPNLALLFGGPDSLPSFLSRQTIPGFDIVVDPCAALLVIVVTALLCAGIKESAVVQGVVTLMNVCALVFIIAIGGYLGFKNGWKGYELSTGYFPYGVSGMLAGASTVFFAYTGFDSVTSTAEEVKNPQTDLPIGVGLSLSICCSLYMMVSAVFVGLVPYYETNPDTPISSAFASYGMKWAAYIITIGTCTALCSSLLGSLLPQSRILMAMARDGLVPSFFSDVDGRTRVPVKSTVVTGSLASVLAFFMDVDQLSGMVSLGTLLAFTTVAVCVLILRYVPPDEVPLSPSFREAIDLVSSRRATSSRAFSSEEATSEDSRPLLLFELRTGTVNKEKRRKIATWAIAFIVTGVVVLTSASSSTLVSTTLRTVMCGVGGAVVLSGSISLSCIEQDEASRNFGHKGGFVCPFVPFFPVACILINVYLLVNLRLVSYYKHSHVTFVHFGPYFF
ncbi:hypothetical protein M569_07889, partial [Genlisea aurea]